MTVLDLLSDALTAIGELGQGESLAPEDTAYCLVRLNAMLDSWAIQRLFIYEVATAAYTLTANKATYQIGAGATDFAVPRPTKIETAAILLQVGSQWTRQDITDGIIPEREWVAVKDQGATATTPEKLYCDYGFPIATLNLNPAPSCPVATKLELGTWQPIGNFTALTTVLNFPPGYYHAILWNLCVEISPGYDRPVDTVTAAKAEEGKRAIASLNLSNLPAESQAAMAAAVQQPAPAPPQQQ